MAGTGNLYPKFWIGLASIDSIVPATDLDTSGHLDTFLAQFTSIDDAQKGGGFKTDGETYDLTTGKKPRNAYKLDFEIKIMDIDYDRLDAFDAMDGQECNVYEYDSTFTDMVAICEGIILFVDIETPGGSQGMITIKGSKEHRTRTNVLKVGKVGSSTLI